MYESERKTVQEFEQGGILCDVPLSQQIYDFIDRSGKDGVTTVVFLF